MLQRRRHQALPLVVASVVVLMALTGCEIPRQDIIPETPPAPDPVVATPPAPDPEPEEQAEEITYPSTQACIEGAWEIDNASYVDYFALSNPDAQDIEVVGVVTVTFEPDRYRMFFEEWEIRSTLDEPQVVVRNGNDATQYVLSFDDVLVLGEQEEDVRVDQFLVEENQQRLGVATTEKGPLDLAGAQLRCTVETLEVDTIDGVFLLNRL